MFYSAINIPGQAQFENEFDFQVVWLIPTLSLFKDLLVSILCNNLLFYLHMTIKYDGLEGSSSREYFFYFSCKVFYFLRSVFLFLGKKYLNLALLVVSEGHFGNMQTELARALTHTDKELFPQHNSMENLLKQTVKEEIRKFMEKKTDESMENICSSSSNIKDDLPKSLRTGRNVWEGSQTEYVGRTMIIIRRKE